MLKVQLKHRWITICKNSQTIAGLYVEKNAALAIGFNHQVLFTLTEIGLPISDVGISF